MPWGVHPHTWEMGALWLPRASEDKGGYSMEPRSVGGGVGQLLSLLVGDPQRARLDPSPFSTRGGSPDISA